MSGTEQVNVSLLPIEVSTALLEEPGITSITFYDGDLQTAQATIRDRFRQIVDTNTWLAGHLEQKQLVYPSGPVSDAAFKGLLHPTPESLSVGSAMPYEKMSKAVESAIVLKGRQLMKKPLHITRLTLMEDADRPGQGFALILSISHAVADGDTYYRILNALSENAEVPRLRATRKEVDSELIVRAVGEKEFGFSLAPPVVINLLVKLVFGKKPSCYAFYVDSDKVRQSKEKTMDETKTDVAFVSTNDILTSSFANTIRARLCMMAVNFRGRIDGLKGEDAGNYEGNVLYDEGVYGSPAGIRKSLQSEGRLPSTSRALPSFFEALTCRLGQVSNWAGFADGITIEGCQQKLHLPLYSVGVIPFDCAIIFQPVPNRLAVMYFARTITRAQLLSRCELGESVSESIFG